MLKAVHGHDERVQIYGLQDLTHEDDISHDWGRYVLENVDRYLYKAPELMIYGNDEFRSNWFSSEDIKGTSEFIVPRSRIPVSGTMLRKLMIEDNRREWMKWVDPKLHKMYDRLRAELMNIYNK